MAHAHARWQPITLHLPRPGMHYSGADTRGQQAPLSTGQTRYTKPTAYQHTATYSHTYQILSLKVISQAAAVDPKVNHGLKHTKDPLALHVHYGSIIHQLHTSIRQQWSATTCTTNGSTTPANLQPRKSHQKITKGLHIVTVLTQ